MAPRNPRPSYSSQPAPGAAIWFALIPVVAGVATSLHHGWASAAAALITALLAVAGGMALSAAPPVRDRARAADTARLAEVAPLPERSVSGREHDA